MSNNSQDGRSSADLPTSSQRCDIPDLLPPKHLQLDDFENLPHSSSPLLGPSPQPNFAQEEELLTLDSWSESVDPMATLFSKMDEEFERELKGEIHQDMPDFMRSPPLEATQPTPEPGSHQPRKNCPALSVENPLKNKKNTRKRKASTSRNAKIRKRRRANAVKDSGAPFHLTDGEDSDDPTAWGPNSLASVGISPPTPLMGGLRPGDKEQSATALQDTGDADAKGSSPMPSFTYN